MPKILFQKSMGGGLDWDDDVEVHIANQFQHWMACLGLLFSLAVTRYLAKDSFQQVDFYLSCIEDGLSSSFQRQNNFRCRNLHLIIASRQVTYCTKKTVCIPRLQLCSMFLGCKLLRCVLKSIQTLQLVVDVSAWSDSTIALAWLRSTPNRYSTFVANRIAKTQQMLPADKWKHVPAHHAQPIIKRDQ